MKADLVKYSEYQIECSLQKLKREQNQLQEAKKLLLAQGGVCDRAVLEIDRLLDSLKKMERSLRSFLENMRSVEREGLAKLQICCEEARATSLF